MDDEAPGGSEALLEGVETTGEGVEVLGESDEVHQVACRLRHVLREEVDQSIEKRRPARVETAARRRRQRFHCNKTAQRHQQRHIMQRHNKIQRQQSVKSVVVVVGV